MNKELFEKKIKEMGVKKGFLAEKCGMSYQSFTSKVNGDQPPFNIRQIEVLKHYLQLSFDEVEEIFFKGSVE